MLLELARKLGVWNSHHNSPFPSISSFPGQNLLQSLRTFDFVQFPWSTLLHRCHCTAHGSCDNYAWQKSAATKICSELPQRKKTAWRGSTIQFRLPVGPPELHRIEEDVETQHGFALWDVVRLWSSCDMRGPCVKSTLVQCVLEACWVVSSLNTSAVPFFAAVVSSCGVRIDSHRHPLFSLLLARAIALVSPGVPFWFSSFHPTTDVLFAPSGSHLASFGRRQIK